MGQKPTSKPSEHSDRARSTVVPIKGLANIVSSISAVLGFLPASTAQRKNRYQDRSGKKNRLGRVGETLAIRFLKRAGYYVWKRNCAVGGGEIDIIAMRDHTLVFVEVKTRANASKYDPLYAVDDDKVKQLTKLADTFIEEHEPYLKRIRVKDYRFDIIGITLKGRYLCRKESLIHCEGAFDYSPSI